jgi:hypothetical protein
MTDEELENGLTASERHKEALAAAAAARIKTGQHWRDWMMIADGLMVGRTWAMRRAGGRNDPKGSVYAKEFSAWLARHAWARELDSQTRNHLFWCAERQNEIESWREALPQNVRARLNHPTAVKRRYENDHRVPVGADTGNDAVGKEPSWKEKFIAAEAEIARLKQQLRQSDDADARFDWNKDKPVDIATILVKLYPTKSKTVASEILRQVNATSRATKRAKAKAE